MKAFTVSNSATSMETFRSRADILAELRRLLPRLESVSDDRRAFSFGLPALDAHLPAGGLAAGALHEIGCAGEDDMPSAFAFMAALMGQRIMGRMPREEPLLLILSPQGLADCGTPYGHGLAGFGLDPARLILVETRDDDEALWAIEEGLRSAVPAVVAGVVGKELDLKASRRLHLAAGHSGVPLLLLRPAWMTGSSAAATRWRVASAKAAQDRFGLLAARRWHLRLERCRNGQIGEWLVEFDHAAYRFSLAAEMADPALPQGGGAPTVVADASRS
jgi:protein ImuA